MSNKLLWSIISNKVVLSSDAVLKDELDAHIEEFKQLLGKNKPRNKEESGEKQIGKIGILLNLSNSDAEDLLFHYMTSSFRGTALSAEEIIKDERKFNNLLLELFQFHKSERQYLLQTLKCIIDGVLHKSNRTCIFEEFLDKCYGRDGPKELLLKLLTQLLEEVVSQPVFDSQALNQEYERLFAWYNLREFIETLSLLNITLKKYTWNGKDFLQLLQVSQKNGFGGRMPLRFLFDGRCEGLTETIGQLETCILIQMMCLKPLLDTMSSLDHPILEDGSTVREIEVVLSGMGMQKEHGPLLVSWMIMQSLGPLGDEALVKYQSLGQKAVEQRVLGYIATMTKSVDIKEIIHPIIYEFLTTLSSKFEPTALGTSEDLNAIMEEVLTSRSIAEDFWSDGLDVGLGQVLTEVTLMYPAVSIPFLKVMDSLAGASASSCQKSADLLNDFPGLASYLDEIAPSHITKLDGDTYTLNVNKEFYGHLRDHLILPAGTEGQLITKHFGREIIQWSCAVPAWRIFKLQTQDLLYQVQHGMSSVQSETVNIVKSIVKLILTVLQHSPESYQSLETLSELLLDVFDCFSLIPNAPNDLLSVFLQLVGQLLLQDKAREGILHRLKQNGLLPHFLGLVDNPLEMVMHTELNSALVGSILAGQECVTGLYPFTVAFLEFINSCIKAETSNTDIVYPCIVFILREIFPTHPKWRFDDLHERNKVIDLCLDVFSSALESKDVTLQTLTVSSLLYGPAAFILLELIAIGDKVIQSAFESDTSFGNGPGSKLMSHVGKGLALLNRLFQVRTELHLENEIKDMTLAERLLRAQPSGHSQPHLALTVAHYLFNRQAATIPICAVQLLTFMALDSGLSLLACFGSDDEAIVDILLRRISYGTDDIRLKEAILKFMTVCVDHQPGLLQVLIDANEGQKKKRISTPSAKSAVLKALSSHFKEFKGMKNETAVRIFKASTDFCCALWASGCIPAISALKSAAGFWDDILEPLNAEKPDCGCLTSCLQLLSLDLFASRWQPESELQNRLKGLLAEKSIVRLLQVILQFVEGFQPSQDLSMTLIESSRPVTEGQELYLLNAFRDFFIIIMNDRSPIKIQDSAVASLIENAMESLCKIMKDNKFEIVKSALTNLLVVLISNCKREETLSVSAATVSELLSTLCPSFMGYEPRLQINVLAIALQVFSASTDFSGIAPAFLSVMEIFNSYLQRIPNFLQEDKPHLAFQRAVSLLLALVRTMVFKLKENEKCLDLMDKMDLAPSLLGIVRMTIQVERGIQVCEGSLAVLAAMAEISQFAVQLLNLNLGTSLWLPASSLPMNETAPKASNEWQSDWSDVWKYLIHLCNRLMDTQSYHALNEGLSLIGLGLDRFSKFLIEGPTSIECKKLDLSLAVLNLLNQLSKFKKEWKAQHKHSCDKIMPIVYRSIYISVALLLRPTLLGAILDNKRFSTGVASKRRAHAFDVDHHPISLSNIHRESISESVAPRTPSKLDVLPTLVEIAKNPGFLETQQRLLDLLTRGIAVLSELSPSLEAVLVKVNYLPTKEDTILSTSLSTPALEDKEMNKISAGTLVAVATVCLRFLRDDVKKTSQVLIATLQMLLAQAKLVCDVGDLSGEELQAFKRELGGEFGLIEESVRRITQRRAGLIFEEHDKKAVFLLTSISKKLL
ncbi:nucleoporin NUP188-like [Artemia franciscana]|uniref:nucleoporin NUP188-like n=1 Tax=Artemia franciscana TaxID=6661 RepID=UPI0032DA9432